MLDFHWQNVSVAAFIVLQMFLFATHRIETHDSYETAATTAITPYVSLAVAYSVILSRDRTVAIIMSIVGLLLVFTIEFKKPSKIKV